MWFLVQVSGSFLGLRVRDLGSDWRLIGFRDA